MPTNLGRRCRDGLEPVNNVWQLHGGPARKADSKMCPMLGPYMASTEGTHYDRLRTPSGTRRRRLRGSLRPRRRA